MHFDTDYKKQYFQLYGFENLNFILGKAKIVKGKMLLVIMHHRILNLSGFVFFYSHLFCWLEDFSLMHVPIQGDNHVVTGHCFGLEMESIGTFCSVC